VPTPLGYGARADQHPQMPHPKLGKEKLRKGDKGLLHRQSFLCGKGGTTQSPILKKNEVPTSRIKRNKVVGLPLEKMQQHEGGLESRQEATLQSHM